MATFTLSLPSAILPELVANSSLFPSVASNWTIPPATLCYRGQVARHWRNFRFSSTNDEPIALQASSGRIAKTLIGIAYQPVDHAEREDRGRERHDVQCVGFGQVENDDFPADGK